MKVQGAMLGLGGWGEGDWEGSSTLYHYHTCVAPCWLCRQINFLSPRGDYYIKKKKEKEILCY